MFRQAYPAMLARLSELFAQAGFRESEFPPLEQQFARLRDCFEQRDRPQQTSMMPASAEESAT